MSRPIAAFALLLAACQSGAAVGTACTRDSECTSPLACSFGRCRSQCAVQHDCPLGAMCLLDQNHVGFCSLGDDPDCTATSCDAPLACIGRECVNVCAAVLECPTGSACAPVGDGRARCVRTDGEDASLPDAASADGGSDAPALDAGTDAAMQGTDARVDAPTTPHDANVDASGACSPRTGTGPCDAVIDVVVSDEHSCVRTQMSHLWCWGENRTVGRDADQTLCSGLACERPALVRVDGSPIADANDVERVFLDHQGGCYTTHDTARMYCWGTFDYETALGTGVTDGVRARPVILGGSPITDTGTFFVFGTSAISSDVNTNDWYGWGSNESDVLQIGAGVQAQHAAVSIGPGWVDPRSVAAGDSHACGILPLDGTIWCWGSNGHGESAPGMAIDPAPPTRITSPAFATDGGFFPDGGSATPYELVVGNTYSCALQNHVLTCWGQLSVLGGASCTDDCPPTTMNTGSLVIEHVWPVSDADDLCVTDAARHLFCWGAGYGTFGTTPTQAPLLPVIASAWLTWSHGCAIDTNAQVWCWGHNDVGQLGLGYVSPEDVVLPPTLVAFP